MELSKKISDFIMRGKKIERIENTTPDMPVSVIAGPCYETWINDIYTFNEHYLQHHPLHDCISNTCMNRKNINAFHDMMGYLESLANDNKIFESTIEQENKTNMRNRKSIDQLLTEDIERCEQYLKNPNDEKVGLSLYIDITGRYDGIISSFGNGLYQYIPDLHFYDPDISGEALIYNLTKLLNKMVTYQAIKYPPTDRIPIVEKDRIANNKVFIVHGHDNEAKIEMARVLEKLGYEAIILHEQPTAGRTIIEKIEANANVAFAVVLYTECDLGRDKDSPPERVKYRARQNVVFEHGYLIGKLGREKVSAFVKGNVETPGDISGVVYTSMDQAGAWKQELVKEMQAAGLNVDSNKLI